MRSIRTTVAITGVALAAMVGFAEDAMKTSPAKVGEFTVESDFAKLSEQFDAVEEVLKNEAYYNLKNEEVSKWSAGDQAGHIVLAAQMMRGALQNNLDNPDQNVDGKVNEQGMAVLKMGDFPRGVAQAPEQLRPEGKTREEFLKILETERKEWKALAAKSKEIGALKSRTPHPAFGSLNSSEWVRFTAIHSAHHLAIVRDILKKSNNTQFGKSLQMEEEAA